MDFNLMLLNAAVACDIELAKEAVSWGAYADAEDERGNTALHYAAARGNLELCAFLTQDCGADVNHKNFNGDTPLHFASRLN